MKKVIKYAGSFHFKDCASIAYDQGVCNCPDDLKPPTKPHSNRPEGWRVRFDDEFVYIDTGPDADGYDAELPIWNEYWEGLRKFDQIEKIKDFIQSELERAVEVERKKQCTQTHDYGYGNGYIPYDEHGKSCKKLKCIYCGKVRP